MRIIHNNKYSDKEIQVFKDAIMANMIHSMKVLVGAAATLSKEISEENKSAAQQLALLDDMDILNASSFFNSELSDNLKKLWSDKAIQECLEERNKFQLYDSTE
jgi:hypothetical protein